MDAILNPELIQVIDDNFGLISLAMLLIASVSMVLLGGTPVAARLAVLLTIIGVYAGVIFVALGQSTNDADPTGEPLGVDSPSVPMSPEELRALIELRNFTQQLNEGDN